MSEPSDSEKLAARLERHKVLICQDTGMGYRDLECVLFLLDEGSLEPSDMKDYGIDINKYR